ncbi:MAG TPA: iron-sulfur cluster repair di-iron protein [Candidatus Angelobacter sp.]|nr:iron-sulfur cluster repair di-iron protein [Candidatus Angelobacter sp.]
MALSPTQTVRQLATEIPNAPRVFERLGIDYCCGGGKSLEAACAYAKIPVADVLRTLEEASVPMEGAATPDFSQVSLRELVSYIVSRHHGYVKQEIPRLHKLLSKVVSVHGRNHAELIAIQKVFSALGAELISHMMKEEMVLFPYIAQMELALESGKQAPRAAFGTVGNPVHMMELEHEDSGNALKKLRSFTSNYTPPQDACFSYNTLFAALKEFEMDLHQHIHLENNILFPRAVALEKHAA